MSRFLYSALVACVAGHTTLAWAEPANGHAGGAEKAGAQMQWWVEARFGLFVHWGPVSLAGTEIGWSRGGERRGTGGTGTIPVDVYDNLYQRFNPTKFNADEWVAIAQAAGMKYLVFTTRHHDGFSMFDSQVTDYKITSAESPFRRDVVKELADACHRAGLHLGFYYSQPDWHHADYRTDQHARYLKYLHGQLRELCTNYGKVDILWFDGLGGTAADWDAENLCRMIRELQPGLIINNRCGLSGDHDTPEQEIGKFQKTRPWESCITIGTQWTWKPDDQIKSLKECIQTLIRCAGGDGNLLLNVGPMPTGEIEPRQVARLKEIGAWLKRYGESIYGTRGGPYKPARWGVSTYKGNSIYLHILDWSADRLTLRPLPKKIVRSSLLTGGQVSVRQTQDTIEIHVPPSDREEVDTIVVLELEGSAHEIEPLAGNVPSKSLAFGKSAKASNVFENRAEYGPNKALDDDDQTRWATDFGIHQAWLEVDLGAPQSVAAAFIREECGQRVQQFELQYQDGQEWKVCARGSQVGPACSLRFAPITARVFRLHILKAEEGPTISELHLFPPQE